MNPSDFDDGDGFSFDELPPSVRARYAQQQPPPQPAPGFGLRATDLSASGTVNTSTASAQPATGAQAMTAMVPMPVGQYVQSHPIQNIPGGLPPGADGQAQGTQQSEDKSPWLFIGATALLGALGWWAYSKMEKEKKIRVGPPQLGRGRDRGYDGDDHGGYGGDDGDDYDDPYSDGPLDAYENVRKPKKMVDPHEKGGIKLVKG